MQTAMTALSKSRPGSLAINPLPLKPVIELFDKLRAILGPKVDDLYAGLKPDFVMTEWAAGLAGFRGREIERGIAACRTRVFAPNLGEFTRLCRPCLDSDHAWIEAEHALAQRERGQVGDWSHPAVFRAATLMSAQIRSNEATAWNRKRWAVLLQRELAHGWGDEVPEVPMRLEATPVVTGPPDEAAKKAIAELRGRFVAVDTTDASKEAAA